MLGIGERRAGNFLMTLLFIGLQKNFDGLIKVLCANQLPGLALPTGHGWPRRRHVGGHG